MGKKGRGGGGKDEGEEREGEGGEVKWGVTKCLLGYWDTAALVVGILSKRDFLEVSYTV
jgi:hypothetical protein